MPPLSDLLKNVTTGSTATGAASGLAQLGAFYAQRALLDNQYNRLDVHLDRYGATPNAKIEALSGGVSSTPSVSAGPSMPDLGANIVGARQAQTAADVGESQVKLNDQLFNYNPKRWFADLSKTYAEVREINSRSGLNKSMQRYYNEWSESLAQKRPWEIKSLKQGLLNAQAELSKILEETKTIKKQGNLYDSQSSYYNASSEFMWSQKFNADLEAFRLQFENSLRASGWNPSERPFDNLERIMFSSPKDAQKLLDSMIQTMNILDNKMKAGLGENYKRNVGILAGLYFGNRAINRHKDQTIGRLVDISRIAATVGSFGLPSTPVRGFAR